MPYSVAVGGSLAKRLVEGDHGKYQWELPSTGVTLLVIGNWIVFLPIFLVLLYSLQHVYPTLAAVEDPLPAYEALPLNDDGSPKSDNDPIHTAQPGRPITSSLRATNRLIRSLGGWLSNFRGLGYSVLIGTLTVLTTLVIALLPFVPLRLAHLFALIATAPLSTTWVHLVITGPSARSFSKRIPPIKKVYLATWFPTFLLWAAAHASVVLPGLLAYAIGLDIGPQTHPSQPDQPDQPGLPPATGSNIGKAIAVLGVTLGLQALLLIPADTALRRVQASLLPPDEDTIVPFDRSFAGRVEPEVVSGKGFATFGAAIKTITPASWVRIYLLRIKVFFVTMAAYTVMALVFVVQLLIVNKVSGSK